MVYPMIVYSGLEHKRNIEEKKLKDRRSEKEKIPTFQEIQTKQKVLPLYLVLIFIM